MSKDLHTLFKRYDDALHYISALCDITEENLDRHRVSLQYRWFKMYCPPSPEIAGKLCQSTQLWLHIISEFTLACEEFAGQKYFGTFGFSQFLFNGRMAIDTDRPLPQLNEETLAAEFRQHIQQYVLSKHMPHSLLKEITR